MPVLAQPSFEEARAAMVRDQIAARGIRDPALLAALGAVPRELFVPAELVEFAYDDVALPVGGGAILPRPYLVASMIAALHLAPRHRVLQIGTGTGYVAAVLAHMASEVVTVEHHDVLADTARRRLHRLGLDTVQVVHADGSMGHPSGAPWDRIVGMAGGPRVPSELEAELADTGVLVIPVGEARAQRLLRVRREGGAFVRDDLGVVELVPLHGAAGFPPSPRGTVDAAPPVREVSAAAALTTPELIAQTAEPIEDLETCSLDGLLDRIGDARVVLLGESTHGTSEFYRMRARITRALLERKGFRIVAVEADWPDAARVDAYVRHRVRPPSPWIAFSRFPTWMWRNEETLGLVEWLRDWNRDRDLTDRAGFYGLDLYSLQTSIAAVVSYLDHIDPAAARMARARYGCLTPYQADPATYGRLAVTGRFATCEDQVVSMLRALLAKRSDYARRDGDGFLDAAENARLAADAERYYRLMYRGSRQSWNLRDTHMFETMCRLLDHHGANSKIVVWAHTSHVGDASATELAARGTLNLGQLTRARFGRRAYLVGLATDHGTVAAATDWDGPMEVKPIPTARTDSYEHLFHVSGLPGFFLPLHGGRFDLVRDRLAAPRLQRAIGVIYRPETELESHYLQAVLPAQLDELIWFDETEAVTPLQSRQVSGAPDTWPFGL